MKSRKITVKVKNKELNAFEDFLVVKFKTKKEKEKARKRCLKLWGKLVRKYDKS